MKKIIATLLILLAVLSLAASRDKENGDNNRTDPDNIINGSGDGDGIDLPIIDYLSPHLRLK